MSDKVLSVLYWSDAVENTERRFGSDNRYFLAYVIDTDGVPKAAAFTRDELLVAMRRGRANPEDMRKPAGGLRRLWAWWFR
jgi:hypothetical protein